jgi:integrase/recombinase XerD
MLSLFGLQGLRTVEIQRANRDDLQQRADGWALLLRGKFHDRLVYLRADVAEALNLYIDSQTRVVADAEGTPLFTCVGNRAIGRRITPRGVRFTVDGYLARTQLKRPRVSDHALRHTAATLAYRHSQTCAPCRTCSGIATRARPHATRV